ncbi:MAG: T9SS type A sorting domain-containing protein [candidate division Zixibacteria bacterium]|nr:T9SS type A sorting domain-containing protein [candidate division Zixibacteria bacterium]
MKDRHFTSLVVAAGVGVAMAFVPAGSTIWAADISVSDIGAASEQLRPRVAVSPGQGFLVVWEDKRSGTGDVFMQRFDLAGWKLGLNLRVNDDSGTIVQTAPSVAADGFGKYTAVWQDYRNGSYPFRPNIYSQQFDSTGTTIGTNRRITVEPPDSLRSAPDLALAPWGGGLVVWQDYRNRNWDIYAQRIASDGSLIGKNILINDDLNLAQQHAPKISASPDGWFVVVWYDSRWANDDIFVQRLDSAGGKIGRNIKVNSDAGSARQAFPDVAADGAGNFTVVWTDWRNGSYPNNPDIYARKFDTLMNALYVDVRVNKDGSTRSQRDPSIAADRLGNVGIVWSDSGATSFDIVGQMIDVEGNVREQNFRANSSTDSAQVQPDIALDGRNRFVTWADKRGANWDIYASVAKYNSPSLVPSPATLAFSAEKGEPLPAPKTLAITHAGYNRLSFRLTSSVSWLNVTPDTGTTTDTVLVAVTDTSLAAGTYSGAITLVDLTNHDSSVVVPVTFDYRQQPPDTLRLGSVQAGVGSIASVTLAMYADDSVLGVVMPLSFDTAIIRVDSFVSSDSLPLNLADTVLIDSTGRVAVVLSFDTLAPLPNGRYRLGSLWITALAQGMTTLDTTRFDTLVCLVRTASGKLRIPVVQTGDVTVDQATGVEDQSPDPLPSDFALAQNYPNPFNGETVIGYDLPRPGRVRLEVFNLLGQRVAIIKDRVEPAGRHVGVWDGKARSGGDLPSGVYFYRLQVGPAAIVRKMTLIK